MAKPTPYTSASSSPSQESKSAASEQHSGTKIGEALSSPLESEPIEKVLKLVVSSLSTTVLLELKLAARLILRRLLTKF